MEGKRDLRDRTGKTGCRESSALRVEPQSPEPGSGEGIKAWAGQVGRGAGSASHGTCAAQLAERRKEWHFLKVEPQASP